MALKNFGQQMLKVIKNLKLIFIIIATATEGILLKGFLGFISKYFEYQFELQTSTSTLITGAIALISVIAGTLLSAFLINRLKWTPKHCSIFCFVVYFLTSFCFFILLNYCPEMQFVNVDYGQADSFGARNCSACNCENRFNPVCLSTAPAKYIYLSPCHAGCLEEVPIKTYSKCKCLSIDAIYAMNDTSQNELTVSSDFCETKVKCLVGLIFNCLAAFLIVFLTAIALIPQLKAILGTVETDFQSFALGVRAAVVRIVGNCAGAILVGYAVDLTCKYWQRNCYNQKVCKLYKNKSMSFALTLIGFLCRLLSALFMLLASVLFIREERANNVAHFKSNTISLKDELNNTKNTTVINDESKCDEKTLKTTISDSSFQTNSSNVEKADISIESF